MVPKISEVATLFQVLQTSNEPLKPIALKIVFMKVFQIFQCELSTFGRHPQKQIWNLLRIALALSNLWKIISGTVLDCCMRVASFSFITKVRGLGQILDSQTRLTHRQTVNWPDPSKIWKYKKLSQNFTSEFFQINSQVYDENYFGKHLHKIWKFLKNRQQFH